MINQNTIRRFEMHNRPADISGRDGPVGKKSVMTEYGGVTDRHVKNGFNMIS
jgi:hypothetical protein